MRALVCGALALLAVAWGPSDAEASSRCDVRGARVWDANEVARLLVRTTGRGAPALYGCLRGQARARRLAGHVVGVRPGTGKGPVLAGRWALFKALDRWGSSELIRVNLVSGRRRIFDRLHAKVTLRTTNSYVLKRNGSPAWITSTSLGVTEDLREETILRVVNLAERGRRVRLIDSASYLAFTEPDPIPEDSLRLSPGGRVLHWIRSGQPRSAPMS
jgi:hypothetical protein